MDKCMVIDKAIKRIANDYDLTVDIVMKAIEGSRFPLDFDRMVEEGSFCFRGPDDESKADNASICLASKILANKGVQEHILPVICNRINAWDHENIEDLLSLLQKAISIMELNPDDHPQMKICGLDIEHLPSENIQAIRPTCRIWAMDKKGMCLTGTDANEMVHIDDIPRE
ncbi:MAG: hypothetical protein WBL02_06570 [Methanomethylovorans sp.]|uniref:hypothetical protein n=1 Tax=Methanomethylovorans sp. TaxID=2758717 RepID=UPI000A92C110|nr:hypothetical protein [Methanomethylovorans sp.]